MKTITKVTKKDMEIFEDCENDVDQFILKIQNLSELKGMKWLVLMSTTSKKLSKQMIQKSIKKNVNDIIKVG